MKYTISNSNKEQLRDLIMPYVKMSDMEKLRVYYSILAVLDKKRNLTHRLILPKRYSNGKYSKLYEQVHLWKNH